MAAGPLNLHQIICENSMVLLRSLRNNGWLVGVITTYILLFVSVLVYSYWFGKHGVEWSQWGPIRFLYDDFDLKVYLRSSAWINGHGTLYREVPSEYPLAANLIFAVIRSLSLNSLFERQWIIISLLMLLACIILAFKFGPRGYWLIWLLPGVIYLSIYRFDIFPAFAVMACLALIKRKQVLAGALFLSFAISLKGYSAFMLPCILMFVYYNYGTRMMLYFAACSLAPFALLNLVTIGFAGMDGFLSAYLLHAQRSFNSQSLYDSLRLKDFIATYPFIPRLVVAAFSLGAAFTRPRYFDQLVVGCLLAVTGFTLAIPFYSPQFCLWLLAIASFSSSGRILVPVFALCAAVYLYYPMAWDSPIYKQDFIGLSVNIASLSRVAIVLACLSLSVPKTTLAVKRFVGKHSKW